MSNKRGWRGLGLTLPAHPVAASVLTADVDAEHLLSILLRV